MKNKLLNKKKIPLIKKHSNKNVIALSTIAFVIAGALVLKLIADKQSDERIPY